MVHSEVTALIFQNSLLVTCSVANVMLTYRCVDGNLSRRVACTVSSNLGHRQPTEDLRSIAND